MAAKKYSRVRADNVCLQWAPADVNYITRLADGTDVKVGQLVIPGGSNEKVDPAGAGAENAIGVCIGFWDNAAGKEGEWNDLPGTAVPDKAKCKIAPFVSGLQFIGLLPNTVVTAEGEKLKAAAAGRVTNLTGTATADEVLATYVRALEAVTAAADDDKVLLEVV